MAAAYTVAQIFADEFRLVLPYFQRGYAWQQEHVGRLLADILRMAEGGGEIDWYPLGSIIVVKRPEAPEAWVADGHQRLITLTIIIAILRDLEPDPGLKAELAARVVSGAAAAPPTEYRLTTHEAARLCLQSYVQADDATGRPFPEPDEDVSDSEENIIANRDFLLRELRGLASDRRRKLARFLSESCYILVTMVEDQQVARLLFSTMHDTGLKPSTVDLFKAQVLGRVIPDARERCRTVWERLEARLGQSGLDALFRHVAVLKTRRMPKQTVHETLQEHFDLDEAEGARVFVTRHLSTMGEHFARTTEAPLRPDVMPAAIARRLQYLGWVRNHDTWNLPLLHWLARNGAEHPDTPTFVARLEALAWLEMIRGEEPARRDRRYISIVEAIDGGNALAAGGPLEIERAHRREVRAILAAPNFTRRRYKLFLLLRINAAIDGDDRIRPLPEATIEHVFPQSPATGSQWLADFRGSAETSRFRNLLGNLTLLTEAEQNEVRNHDFAEKRPLLGQSAFALSRRLAGRTVWRPGEIGRNTDEMIDILMRSWGIA